MGCTFSDVASATLNIGSNINHYEFPRWGNYISSAYIASVSEYKDGVHPVTRVNFVGGNIYIAPNNYPKLNGKVVTLTAWYKKTGTPKQIKWYI